MWRLLTGLVWGVPLLMLPHYLNGFTTPKAYLWLVGSFALISSSFWNPPSKLGVRNPWIGYLLIWVVFLFSWQLLRFQLLLPKSFELAVQMPWFVASILPMLFAVTSLLAIEVLVRHTDTLDRWVTVSSTLCYVAGFVACYGIAQMCGLDRLLHLDAAHGHFQTFWTPITTFGNPGRSVTFLAIVAPLCLMFSRKRFWIIYALITVNLVSVQSVSALTAWAVGTGLVLGFQRRWGLLGGFGAVCFAALTWAFWTHHISLSFINPGGRLAIWGKALEIWYDQAPWIGMGLGAMEFPKTNPFGTWMTLHSEPVQILYETGIIGLVLAGGMVLHLGQRVWRMHQTVLSAGWIGAAAAFLVVACVWFPLRLGAHLMLGVLIMACLEAQTQGGAHGVSA